MSKRARTYAVTNNRSRTQVINNALRRRARSNQQQDDGGVQPMAWSGTSQQSMRTGGWANPSRMIGELKFTDVGTRSDNITASVSTFTTPGGVFLLNGLAPGSSANQRIGRKVVMKSVYLRGYFAMGATSTGGSPFRVLVVYDKQANATAFATTDVLVQDDFRAANNISNRDRFVVLADRMVDYIGTGDKTVAHFEIFKKINLETMFNAGSAGSIGDITSGSIYVMFAQTGFIATAPATVNWFSRVRYTDV